MTSHYAAAGLHPQQIQINPAQVYHPATSNPAPLTNPGQLSEQVGQVSVRGSFNSWTLAETFVLTGGGRDPKGNPLPVVETGPFPAQVNPIRSDESVQAGAAPLTAYYRLLMGSGGEKLTPTGQINWRGRTLSIQGDVEPWVVNGRLHHYEATLRVG